MPSKKERLLPDAEFWRLSAEARLAYLKRLAAISPSKATAAVRAKRHKAKQKR